MRDASSVGKAWTAQRSPRSRDFGPAARTWAHSVASILPGFYSSMAEPLDLYRCVEAATGMRCPGGMPATCTGLLNNTACTDCPSGRHWDRSEGQCEECTPWQQLGWILAVAVFLAGLVMVYYMMTAQKTAKASVLFTTTCAFGMTISSLQAVGIIGTMTVRVPEGLKDIYAFLQVFLLDFDNFAFTCVAGGSAPARYIVSVLVFPGAVCWLVSCHYTSKLLPKRLRWEGSKTKSTIGDHAVMLVCGLLLLLVGVMGFLAVCTYAVIVVPRWSRNGLHANVKAFRFLLFRFRLDSRWFGVLLLLRGPLMSLPIALATDYPPVQ
ncbi:GORK, partial [Symbiodinium sp. CCMP2456]